ncbi:MAG: hypothetical protein JXB36_17220, partial [Gammaproteobacteria bacterium]|nr:hypothetical protein [Gammaproteobacteria bacterium]
MPRLILAALLSLTFAVPPAAQEVLHAAAERARGKIESIIANGEAPGDRHVAPVRTTLTEAEVNAFLQVHGPEILPEGITRPEIRLGEDSRVRARATIDLDDVRRSRPRAWNDPLAYVVGSVDVVASGRIVADDGAARAQLESATVAGLSVPKSVVQELLRFYTVTPERPEGFNLDEPFMLPADIRRLVVRRGHATIVQ